MTSYQGLVSVSRLSELLFISVRKFFYSPEMDDPEIPENYAKDSRYEVQDLRDANLVSSEVDDIWHMPVLDIDFPAHLEPSSTPGHYHLYLNQKVSWEQYKKLLDVMGEIGLLEPGFVKLSKQRGATYVRKPGHKKKGK